ncbi:DUF7848 domain-containing protein [Streptomyces chattanoogensis]
MAVQSVWRFVDWVLQLDTSGSVPFFEMNCMRCDETSKAAESPDGPQNWALKHAGRTGHDLFQAVNTCYFRATRANIKAGDDLPSYHTQAGSSSARVASHP